MTEELREGLYLAATGMGLVFLSLLAFMLILIVLGKLFPSEEVEEVDEAVGTPEAAAQEPAQVAQPAPVELAPSPLPEQAVMAAAPPPESRVSGAKIAAMAVAMYLAMEQEEIAAGVPVVALPLLDLSRIPSEWSNQGRVSLWQSQGRRPQAYGQRSYGAYPPREGVR